MKTSLYRFYAEDDTLLYVGQSRNPFQRLNGHFCDKQMDMVRHIELEWFDSKASAFQAEAWAIRREKPLWNVMAPVKPRCARVTPAAVTSRKVSPKQHRQYCVDIDPDKIPGVEIDFTFQGGEEAIRRAFKVARAGDVIHLSADARPIYYANANRKTPEAPNVQFH